MMFHILLKGKKIMKITLLCVGKIKEKYFVDAINEYLKRLQAFAKIEIIEVADEKTQDNASHNEIEIIKNKEAARIDKYLNDSCYKIALTIDGKEMSSEELSYWLKKQMVQGLSSFTFVIGGSLGLSQNIIKKCDCTLSFSKMTFPHQLMRVILLEQIYRSFKILANEPYHK